MRDRRFTNLFSARCFATDFKTARALTNSEVAKVLEQKRSRFQDLGKQPSSDFLKAYQYVNKVKCFKDDAVVAQVRQYACCSGRTHAPRAPFLPRCSARRALGSSPASRAARLRRDLESVPGLDPFEVAQLGNLCPEDASEAKALIPSLTMDGRAISDAQLTDMLEQLNSYKQYNN